jgi:outer membrane murein-binding lipoprotein Lpp
MSEVQDTKAKVDALSTQIDQMQQRVSEDVQALKEQINAGLDGITQRVQAIDPDPSNPAQRAEEGAPKT